MAEKLRRMPGGSILGVGGNLGPGAMLLDYMEALLADNELARPARAALRGFRGVTALWLQRNGDVYLLQSDCGGSITKLSGEFFAEGSGFIAALAAMHMGAGAKRAVEVACAMDTGCALPVRVMRL